MSQVLYYNHLEASSSFLDVPAHNCVPQRRKWGAGFRRRRSQNRRGGRAVLTRGDRDPEVGGGGGGDWRATRRSTPSHFLGADEEMPG
ncbi:hypothetical protein MY10362_005838 [Beauveria mimosiformis]